jgi:G:T-mismatch repair DNA endonuclease (very short patch repair protein)
VSSRKMRKKCFTCGKLLLDKNISGFCNLHRDRNGENNPFYGKRHKTETIERMKEKTRNASKNLWRNKEYRDKVILGMSKPRSLKFKAEQSIRVAEWYKNNPNQRTLRSVNMKNSWENNLITKSKNVSANKSKIQREFFKALVARCSEIVDDYVVRINKKWMFPDILFKKYGVIIEFFGDYWHANPCIYEAKTIVRHRLTAEKIWKKDEQRIRALQKEGYFVCVVWEKDYKDDKLFVLSKFDNLFNWEGCSF